jgi:hypothetical protein
MGSGTVSDPVLTRFEVSPPDLIDAKHHHHYRILQNNDFGLVAASSIAEIEEGQKGPTVGAYTVVINKGTGEFWLGTTIAGQAADAPSPPEKRRAPKGARSHTHTDTAPRHTAPSYTEQAAPCAVDVGVRPPLFKLLL